MSRLAAILFAAIALASCTTARKEPPLPQPTREQGQKILHAWFLDYDFAGAVSADEAKDNLQWFREHYLDAPLTRALNAHSSGRKLVPFEQPLLFPIRYQGEELYQNFEDWTVTVNGQDIKVPAGLVVDGASVPRACWFFMPPDGLHRGAALFHDWSYINRGCNLTRGPPLTRKETDEAFYNLMIEAGVSPNVAGIAYRGVRLGGWAAWASRESPLILPVDRHRMATPHFLLPRTRFSHLYAP